MYCCSHVDMQAYNDMFVESNNRHKCLHVVRKRQSNRLCLLEYDHLQHDPVSVWVRAATAARLTCCFTNVAK